MTAKSPLATLVGAYFHQDVYEVYADEFAAAEDYIDGAPELATGLLKDIAELLEDEPDEEGLKAHVQALGSAIGPGDLTYREWLTQIADRVRAATA